jgi:non-specific serine/threonine protein kinase
MEPDIPTWPLSICLFGPFAVQREGEPLPRLRSRKGHWLLALLTLRHGREVQRGWLAGTLWPDDDEADALHSLRQSLTDLRRALGTQATRLHSPTSHTLLLDLSGAYADVLTFDTLMVRGDAASLEQAVALYRGPLLEGCLEEWVVPEREAREQSYLSAQETLAQHSLECKDFTAAVQRLRQVVALDPLRESSQRSLMQALASDGDYAAAVQVYRDLRLLLQRELNTTPDPATTALFQQIREEARRRMQPRPALVSLPSAAPHRLPHPLTALIGRRQEIQQVVAYLHTARLVTLTGTGGVGKTRLAIAVAEEMEGRWFVELAALNDPALVLPEVAERLGVLEQPGRSLLDGVRDYLESRVLLLVLDNCEHLLEGCAQVVQQLLEASAGLRVLATSRQALGLTGETVYQVPSLSVPDVRGLEAAGKNRVGALLEYEAAQLFVARAGQAQPGFVVTVGNAATIGQVCADLEGIPLALELAAARVRAMSLDHLASRLDDRLGLLRGGNRMALPRHQTLRATLDWSYELLSGTEQALLARLSVFSGGWSLEAAEAICAEEDMADWEVLDLLTSLVDKSLVLYEDQSGTARYRLLETVRQYSLEKLRDSRELELLRARHQQFFVMLAEQAEPNLRGPEQKTWYDRLETEHENLREAWDWNREAEGAEASLRLASALWRFWYMRGYLSEGRNRLVAAQQSDSMISPTVRARALHAAGTLALAQSDYAAAQTLLEQSVTLRRELGDREGMAHSLTNLGAIARYQGDLETARTLFEESLALRREVGDRHGIADALAWLGNLAYDQGDFTAAYPLYTESLTIYRELGNRANISNMLSSLGGIASEQRAYPQARALLEESLAISRELDDRPGMVATLSNLGNTAYRQGDYAAAQRRLHESLSLAQELGDKSSITIALETLAYVAVAQGEAEQAARLFGAAENLRTVTASPLPPSEQEEYARLVAEAHTDLGEEAFAEAWAQGQSMTLEQALTYALESRRL